MKPFLVPILFLAALVSGCGFVHEEHLVGPYRLNAVDTDEQMSVCYELGDGAVDRISQTVFAVGWNDRYIVAKQHPNGDRSVTNYFYLDMSRDAPNANPKRSVVGPLTTAQFQAKKAELGLPAFKRVITSLQ